MCVFQLFLLLSGTVRFTVCSPFEGLWYTAGQLLLRAVPRIFTDRFSPTLGYLSCAEWGDSASSDSCSRTEILSWPTWPIFFTWDFKEWNLVKITVLWDDCVVINGHLLVGMVGTECVIKFSLPSWPHSNHKILNTFLSKF